MTILKQSAPEQTRMFTTNALTWEPIGGAGCVLPITAILTPTPPGKVAIMHMRGTMGDSMKNSIREGATLARHAVMERNTSDLFYKYDLTLVIPDHQDHMYDGSSAGLAAFSSVLGVMLCWESNPQVAMTGEVSPDGTILKVGAICDKIRMAHEHDINTIFFPHDNISDELKVLLEDTPVTAVGVKMVGDIIEFADQIEEDLKEAESA